MLCNIYNTVVAMSDNNHDSSPDEDHKTLQKKKKRLYTPRTRAKHIVTAGPSQDPQVPIAESELLDFRNRVAPPVAVEPVPVIPTETVAISSEYDASCESLDLKTSDYETRDNAESDAAISVGGMRCQESVVISDAPQEGFPPPLEANLSFDNGYLASSDSFSTSDIHDAVERYANNPDVSQWTLNENPEIRIHYQIIYDRPIVERLTRRLHAANLTARPTEDTTDIDNPTEAMRLYYREVGATSSGGSVVNSSVSTKQEAAANGSHSDVAGNLTDLVYDEAFEEMLINRIQNRIRELGGVGGLELVDEVGLTPAGREVKQRFGFLMRDISDDEAEPEPSADAESGGAERGRRRRRRRAPDWMLTDVPSDETLRTDLDAPPSTVSLGLDEARGSPPPPPRYARSPDSESEVSVLRAIRAEGGDQFVEAVLNRLHQNLRAGHNFREYRESAAGKAAYSRRVSHRDSSSDSDSDAASSRSSTGRVQFKDRVLVRPLVKDPLLTEYRRPYSKRSGQKLSSVKDYKPEPDDPDYEDSLKDKTEPTAAKPPARLAQPAVQAAAAPPPKPQPGWKKLFCCMGGGSADDAAAKPAPAAAARSAPPAAAAPEPPPPPAAAASPEPKRKRRRVKALPVQELDPDITNEELRSLHMMFDDRVELCGLSDPSTDASLDEPSELSDPESDAEPCFSDFLRACGLKEDKIGEYMKFYRTHRGLTDSGRGDWSVGTRHSPDGRPASASSTDDPSWWDRRARERRHELRKARREHREYQRQLDTQRDLEVEGQLRRALETQRELLREREVERELERTRESSKERKELRLEEEVLEKELLRRLLAELQNEQVRSREREKRRTVARILEEELITRLTLALARQREKSEERRGTHDTQRIQEEATTRELKNRIEELRMRIEENKILRDYERDEEQERLKLLEELLLKERKRMEILESSRLEEQDEESKTRSILTELEEKAAEDEVKSQKDYEYCAKTLLKKNELHKAMRQKLTTEIRKRELVKRKLVSLSDIEKSNPRLFQLAKVMEEVTDEKGCLQLEYNEPGTGILKKDSQTEGDSTQVKTEEGEDKEGKKEGGEHIKTEEGTDGTTQPTTEAEEKPLHIKQEPADDYPDHTAAVPVKTEDDAAAMIAMLKTELHVMEPESSTTDDTGGETDLEPPRPGGSSDSNEDIKPPVPQSEAVADSQDDRSDGEAAPQSDEGADAAPQSDEGADAAAQSDEGAAHTEDGEAGKAPEDAGGVEPPKSPAGAISPAEPADGGEESGRPPGFRESGVQVNTIRASPLPGSAVHGREDSPGSASQPPTPAAERRSPSPQPQETTQHQPEEGSGHAADEGEKHPQEPALGETEATGAGATEAEVAPAAAAADGEPTQQAGATSEAAVSEESAPEAAIPDGAGTEQTGSDGAETGITETEGSRAGTETVEGVEATGEEAAATDGNTEGDAATAGESGTTEGQTDQPTGGAEASETAAPETSPEQPQGEEGGGTESSADGEPT